MISESVPAVLGDTATMHLHIIVHVTDNVAVMNTMIITGIYQEHIINTLRFYVSVCVSVSDGSGMFVGRD